MPRCSPDLTLRCPHCQSRLVVFVAQGGTPADLLALLTSNQRQVIALLFAGLTLGQIGCQMKVSVGAVDQTLRRAMNTLGTRSRTGLLVMLAPYRDRL